MLLLLSGFASWALLACLAMAGARARARKDAKVKDLLPRECISTWTPHLKTLRSDIQEFCKDFTAELKELRRVVMDIGNRVAALEDSVDV